MYAVIRAGGKQYRVAPGDVVRVESVVPDGDGNVQFGDVLAISGSEGQIGKPESEALVTGQVLEQGRGAKILVFHYKRKKQYKKLRGHRQGYTSVRINEISYGGESFKAPALPKKEAKAEKTVASVEKTGPRSQGKAVKAAAPAPTKKASSKKPAAKKAASKKKK
jgi:large subunit ribosomal protein L21